jgi:uncharacterized membrane protein YeiH
MDVPPKVLVEALGIVSFALTGRIVATTHGVSRTGAFLAALAAGLGGGTLRDEVVGVARRARWGGVAVLYQHVACPPRPGVVA